MRVAYTLEQLWHRVPGGTAVAAVETATRLRGRDGLELVGVSAWHRRLPEPPWRPPISVRRLPVPPHVLYETWHRLRRPHVERATGPVDVIHATGVAVPPRDRAARRHRPRPLLPRLPGALLARRAGASSARRSS